MNTTGNQLVAEMQSHIGAPFRHHFKPENLCNGGRITVNACMERGMDSVGGFDCSGLVIASMSRILQIDPTAWPRALRHTQQFAAHATEKPFEPGDVTFYISGNGLIHMGVAATPQESIHASGISKMVEQGVATDVHGEFTAIHALAADHLADIVLHSVELSAEYERGP